jgi:ABC-type transport system involved in cytochrome c biogenesis permease subunit
MKKLLLSVICFLGFLMNITPALSDIDRRFSFQKLSSLVILDQGRLKPFETFADAFFLELSGRKRSENFSSVDFLGYLIFDSSKLKSEKVFLINNPQILEILELKPDSHRRYDFEYLSTKFNEINQYGIEALSIKESERTLIDNDFIDLFMKMHAYLQVSTSLDLIKSLAFISESKSEIREGKMQGLLFGVFQKINQNEEYKNIFGSQKKLAIIPEAKKNSSGLIFQDPWDYFGLSLEKLASSPFSKKLIKIYLAYKNHKEKQFNEELGAFNTEVKSFMLTQSANYPQIKLELAYNKLENFLYSKIFYFLAFLAFLFVLLRKNIFDKIFTKISLIFLFLAFLLHSWGLLLRILILGRAPVSNLYESFVFVSWFMVFLAIVFYFLESSRPSKLQESRIFNPQVLIPIVSLGASILLTVSGKFLSEGDTLKVLIAVLDSNFWLSTHVICISIAYAGLALAGLVAHYELIRKDHSNSLLMPLLFFSLCFSFLGTMLGGIWADQSWGRFWGWDPKENGALLIILWIVLSLHMKLAGIIKERGLAIMSVLGLMVLMLSWLGVNLLGVGLHSYGFSSGFALGLGIYFILEMGFLIYQFYTKHSNYSGKDSSICLRQP